MKTLVTHNGTFHADDVFAVATFLLAHKGEDWQIIRSREKDIIEKADAVIDTGHIFDPKILRFDHHQEGGAGQRESGIPFAAFGLVWGEFGEKLCGDKIISFEVDKRIVSPTDAHDNGINIFKDIFDDVSPYELSNFVQAFNPTWVEDDSSGESDRLKIFLELVSIAEKIIEREIRRAIDKKKAEDFVENAYKNAGNKAIIILDKYYPWSDTLIKYKEPMYVIYPNPTTNIWCAKTVSTEDDCFESRKPFPKSWCGKESAVLQETTGVEDAKFCHRSGFLCVAKSKESAIKLAEISLSFENNK